MTVTPQTMAENTLQPDMYEVMKELRKVKFNGSDVPDQVPPLAGDSSIRAGQVGLLNRVHACTVATRQ